MGSGGAGREPRGGERADGPAGEHGGHGERRERRAGRRHVEERQGGRRVRGPAEVSDLEGERGGEREADRDGGGWRGIRGRVVGRDAVADNRLPGGLGPLYVARGGPRPCFEA